MSKQLDQLSSPTNPFADPPPAYVAQDGEGSGQSAERGPDVSESDQFGFLSQFDTVFLIDDSASMQFESAPSSQITRWEQTMNVIQQIVPICMHYDEDGIDIYFLNDPYHPHNIFSDPHKDEPNWSKDANKKEAKASYGYIGVKEAQDVQTVFQKRTPNNSTPTGKRLGEIMDIYVDCYTKLVKKHRDPPKPLNIIVITDGEAGDKDLLEHNLVRTAERLDQLSAPYHQLGVQFFQVGKDQTAAHFLTQLDDNLGNLRQKRELRDIVDCITHDQLVAEGGSTLTADMILKAVLGSVNKHLDNTKIKHGLLTNPA